MILGDSFLSVSPSFSKYDHQYITRPFLSCAISYRLILSSPRTFPILHFLTAMVAGILVPRLGRY